MWRYSDNLRALYETPALTAGLTDNARGRATAAAIINAAQRAGRTLLTEVESKQILEAYGISTVPARIARSEDEAVRIAAELGPLVVLKLILKLLRTRPMPVA